MLFFVDDAAVTRRTVRAEQESQVLRLVASGQARSNVRLFTTAWTVCNSSLLFVYCVTLVTVTRDTKSVHKVTPL